MAGCPYCQIPWQEIPRIPDDVQARCLNNRNGCCLACNKLTNIERKIEEARSALHLLLDEKEALASILNEHHDPVIQRLPPEIVSQIFVLLKPAEPSVDIHNACYNEKELIKAVFTPSHVCKNWRYISRSTPALWNALCVTITRSNWMTSTIIVQDWLERSGGLPLFLQIRVASSPNQPAIHATQKVIALTMMHAQRWEVLDLAVPSQILPWMSEFLSNCKVDQLQHIKTRYHDNWSVAHVLHVLATPHRLTLCRGVLSQVSFNCEQVTHVFVAFLSTNDAKRLFRNAPRLLSCICINFDQEGDETEDMPPRLPVLAPSLRTFKIAEVAAGVWEHFQFPSLDTLGVYWPEDSDDCWSNLAALLRRSGCRIRELDIKEYFKGRNAFIEVLKVTPDLERLSLGGELMGPFFSFLEGVPTSTKGGEGVPNFLGKLRCLSCTTFGDAHNWWPTIAFLNNITSKTSTMWSFQSFSLRITYDVTEELGKDVSKALLDAVRGLDVKIMSHTHDILERARLQANL